MATIMDSIRYQLARFPRDMEGGFYIGTAYGDLYVQAEEAAPFVALFNEMLKKRMEAAQAEMQGAKK